jgi:hypothetical protein
MENTARAIPVRTPTEKEWVVALEAVDSDKIRWAIESFGFFKSAGEDGIFPALLKNGIEISSSRLVLLWNIYRRRGKGWGLFLFQKNVLAKSFRPISLTSFLLKKMERLVDQSIRMGPLKRFPLDRSQHAYQRGRSSETALHDLVSRIESALGHKFFALGAFLDVEGAFDNTFFEAMGRACADLEVDFTISRRIAAMLSRGVSSTMMVRRVWARTLISKD